MGSEPERTKTCFAKRWMEVPDVSEHLGTGRGTRVDSERTKSLGLVAKVRALELRKFAGLSE